MRHLQGFGEQGKMAFISGGTEEERPNFEGNRDNIGEQGI